MGEVQHGRDQALRVVARRSYDLFSEIEGAVRKNKGHLLEGRLQDAGAGRISGPSPWNWSARKT
jgi:hypothetical protein